MLREESGRDTGPGRREPDSSGRERENFLPGGPRRMNHAGESGETCQAGPSRAQRAREVFGLHCGPRSRVDGPDLSSAFRKNSERQGEGTQGAAVRPGVGVGVSATAQGGGAGAAPSATDTEEAPPTFRHAGMSPARPSPPRRARLCAARSPQAPPALPRGHAGPGLARPLLLLAERCP